MSNEATLEIALSNKKGLHARAAAKFVKVVNQFPAHLSVFKIAGASVNDGGPFPQASGGSILGLMMLGAEYGSVLRLQAEGDRSEEVISELKKLIEQKFGEE